MAESLEEFLRHWFHLSSAKQLRPQIKRVQIRNCWEQMPIIGTLFIKKNGPEKRLWSWIEISAIAIGGGMAWWEIVARSQLPLEFLAHEQGAPVLRVFAHLVLFGFMAAATWSDLLHRVIPDAITVPGTLLGLLCVWAFPEILLPIGCEQARSYATPKLVLDVLGPAGGLHCVGMPDGYTAALMDEAFDELRPLLFLVGDLHRS